MRFLTPFIFPFLLGAFTVLGFAPFSFYYVPFFTLSILFYLAFFHGQRPFFSGFFFGLGLFSFGVAWIFNSLKEFGNMPVWGALCLTVLFCVCLSLFYAFPFFIFQKLKSKNIFFSALLFSALFTLFDYLRGNFTFGFPWLVLGYSQTQNPFLNAYFPLFGVYFLHFLCFLIASLIIVIFNKKSFFYILPLFIIFILNFTFSFLSWSIPYEKPLNVVLVQNMVSLKDKFNPYFFQKHIENNFNIIENNNADLFIFAETEIPYFWNELPEFLKEDLHRLSYKKNAHFIFGTLTQSADSQNYFNSAVNIGLNNETFYQKRHLVPFGEFVPYFFETIMQTINVPLSRFKIPRETQKNFKIKEYDSALNICYEDAFGRELKENAQNANFLINISNTIWFGKSLAQAQHLEMAQARALEFQKPVLKSTNSGITAIIDYNGKIVSQLPEFEKGILKGKLIPRKGKTLYGVYADFPVLMTCFLILFFSLFSTVNKRFFLK